MAATAAVKVDIAAPLVAPAVTAAVRAATAAVKAATAAVRAATAAATTDRQAPCTLTRGDRAHNAGYPGHKLLVYGPITGGVTGHFHPSGR
ncbi:hypothetical protein GALL_476620 [mine drainage metagenome]|uniref:Uncharacterized protein n=1 Tax=mine drainage metagenome TaxID=410659 RepID=A0A1J5PGH2_9ZZZZ